jgi:hypothetical protein
VTNGDLRWADLNLDRNLRLPSLRALAPMQSTPHVELLCYRGDHDRRSASAGTNDMAATRLVLKLENKEILEGVCAESPDAILSGPIRFEHGAIRAMLRFYDPKRRHSTTGYLCLVEFEMQAGFGLGGCQPCHDSETGVSVVYTADVSEPFSRWGASTRICFIAEHNSHSNGRCTGTPAPI